MADKKTDETVEGPKTIDLTDPKYFPPMPTEPAEDHAKHLDELKKLGYDVSNQKVDESEDGSVAIGVETKKSDK